MLDRDCDGRSLFARQVFFPMAGAKDGSAQLERNLEAEIDPTRHSAYPKAVSLPSERGNHGRWAVKIVEDRRLEGFEIVELG